MPLFFFISGYVTGLFTVIDTSSKLFGFIKKKLRTLFIPWIVWSLVGEIMFCDIWPKLTLNTIIDILIFPKLWFFRYLLIISILWATVTYFGHLISTYLERKRCDRGGVKPLKSIDCNFNLCAIIIVVSLFLYLISDSDLFLFISCFFGATIISSKFRWMLVDKYVLAISILLFTLVCSHWNYYEHSLQNSLIKLLISISACFSCVGICQKLHFNEHIKKRIMIYGKTSLPIYVIHYIIIRPGLYINLLSESLSAMLIVSVIEAVVVCEICCIFSNIFRASNILGFVLFGDWKTQK